jgi:hypothetical protein
MISIIGPRYILSTVLFYADSHIAHAKISSSALFIIFVAVYNISPWPYLYNYWPCLYSCYSIVVSFHL